MNARTITDFIVDPLEAFCTLEQDKKELLKHSNCFENKLKAARYSDIQAMISTDYQKIAELYLEAMTLSESSLIRYSQYKQCYDHAVSKMNGEVRYARD